MPAHSLTFPAQITKIQRLLVKFVPLNYIVQVSSQGYPLLSRYIVFHLF